MQDHKRAPYLGNTADEILYNRSIAKGENEKDEIRNLKPKLFKGAAGLTSYEEYKINQEDLLMPEYHPEEHKLAQARWGGEGEETIYGMQDPGRADNKSVEYEVQKLVPEKYNGAAGMTSKQDGVAKMRGGDPSARDEAGGGKRMTKDVTDALNRMKDPTPIKTDPGTVSSNYKFAAGLTSKSLTHHLSEDSRYQRTSKLDLTNHGEAATLIYFHSKDGQAMSEDVSLDSFGPVPHGQMERPRSPDVYQGAAGSKSKAVTRTAAHARTQDVSTFKDPGGTEAHDVIYGYDGDGDGNRGGMTSFDDADDPRVFIVPELKSKKFEGSAGMASQDVFRATNRYWMFGEKTEGIEYGAKHRTHHDGRQLPTAAELNSSFMNASHWSDYVPSHMQSSHMQDTPPEPHPLPHSEDMGYYDVYDGVAYAQESDSQYAEPNQAHRSNPQQQSAQRAPSPPPSQRGTAPRSHPQPAERVPSPRGGGRAERSSTPPLREQQQRPPMTGPTLFEKGSFAHRKLENIRNQESAIGQSPMASGRSTNRSIGAMGAYADMAARVAQAESRRSARSSQRSMR